MTKAGQKTDSDFKLRYYRFFTVVCQAPVSMLNSAPMTEFRRFRGTDTYLTNDALEADAEGPHPLAVAHQDHLTVR